jgi:hypothetical protein
VPSRGCSVSNKTSGSHEPAVGPPISDGLRLQASPITRLWRATFTAALVTSRRALIFENPLDLSQKTIQQSEIAAGHPMSIATVSGSQGWFGRLTPDGIQP